MANPVNLAGTMPAEVVNGLFTAVKELLASPKELRLVIGVLDVDTIKVKIATGDEIPVVQFRHIEVITGPNRKAATELLKGEYSTRTGQLELAFTPGAEVPPDTDRNED